MGDAVMNLREIKEDERPLCPQCGVAMEWTLSKTYHNEVSGWLYSCNCIDEDRLKPDRVFKFNP